MENLKCPSCGADLDIDTKIDNDRKIIIEFYIKKMGNVNKSSYEMIIDDIILEKTLRKQIKEVLNKDYEFLYKPKLKLILFLLYINKLYNYNRKDFSIYRVSYDIVKNLKNTKYEYIGNRKIETNFDKSMSKIPKKDIEVLKKAKILDVDKKEILENGIEIGKSLSIKKLNDLIDELLTSSL